MRRLTTVLTAVLASLLMISSASAASATAIKPNQHFIGVVNGTGPSATAVTSVQVLCSNLATTGQVATGQTLSVRAAASGAGFTGPLSQVFAWFDQDVRSPAPTEVTFRRYGTERAVPSTVRVPCSGTGTVTFSPCPRDAPCVFGWTSMQVRVRFVPKSPARG